MHTPLLACLIVTLADRFPRTKIAPAGCVVTDGFSAKHQFLPRCRGLQSARPTFDDQFSLSSQNSTVRGRRLALVRALIAKQDVRYHVRISNAGAEASPVVVHASPLLKRRRRRAVELALE